MKNARTEVDRILRSISDGISIDRIQTQGSLDKDTAIPLNGDVDLCVYVNDYHRAFESVFKQHLEKHEVRMLTSTGNILTGVFRDINFDFILLNAQDPDPYFSDGLASAEKVRRTPVMEHSFIRACKYWVKRCGVSVKSFHVERLAMEVFEKPSDDKIKFLLFLEELQKHLQSQSSAAGGASAGAVRGESGAREGFKGGEETDSLIDTLLRALRS